MPPDTVMEEQSLATCTLAQPDLGRLLDLLSHLRELSSFLTFFILQRLCTVSYSFQRKMILVSANDILLRRI